MPAGTADPTGLYLYEDNVIVEVVDEHNRSVPPSVYGDKALITVLFSRTQRLIRYELDDNLRLAADSGSAVLPFRRIDGIQWRSSDILRLPGISGAEVAVHPIMFHHVLDSLPGSGWQVVQEVDGLRVLLSGSSHGAGSDGGTDAAVVDALRGALVVQNVLVPRISVHRVDTIPKNATGKTPLIKTAFIERVHFEPWRSLKDFYARSEPWPHAPPVSRSCSTGPGTVPRNRRRPDENPAGTAA